MSKVVVSQFITLDGVFQDPGGSEGFDRGGWAFQFNEATGASKFKVDEVIAAGALLLGRVTYEEFAQAWPSRTDDVGFADKMNSMPKYAVSTTLDRGDWNNTTVIRADVPEEVRRLKERVDGDILINGSGQLVQTLMWHDLVDEYRLMMYPTVLGAGRRLFANAAQATPLRLVDTLPAGECIVLIYHPVRAGAGDSSDDAQDPSTR